MEPKHIIVYFNESTGKPLKFKYEGHSYNVAKILLKSEGSKIWGLHNQIYQVITKEGKIAELEWVIDKGEWFLNHID